ncbi:GntR family transcriptional regulator [Gottschalkiaceae bacterium SANA]|nr:GntR family transcriptional regulator [Gottschalkiaceae bacterium SANA]
MNPLDERPLYIQLKNDLLDQIKSGIWQEKDQIPTELELMELYHLGRDTVRKAVSILVQEGYLIKRRGKGTFVAKTQFSIGFEPLISLRYALQVRGLEETNVVLDQFIGTQPKGIADRARMPQLKESMRILRLRVVEGRPLAMEESVFSSQGINLEEVNPHESISRFLLQQWGNQIDRIEQIMTPKNPTKVEREQLELKENCQVLALERWIYVKKKESPISYVSFVIPMTEYDFSI